MRPESRLIRMHFTTLNMAAALVIITAAMRVNCPAAPVDETRVAQMATGWLAEGKNRLSENMPAEIRSIEERGAYYTVQLVPEGYIVVAPDDLIEPVIAFSASGSFDPGTDELLALLLSEDMATRRLVAEAVPTAGRNAADATVGGGIGLTPLHMAAAELAQAKWASLCGRDRRYAALGYGALAEGPAEPMQPDYRASVSDVRVSPLLSTKWSQSKANGQNCFNYSTPYNRVCGCVATAMAQFMRYWHWPKSGIGRQAGYIKVVVNGNTQRWKRYTFGGNGSGGAYDWNNMPLTPHSTTASAYQRQQIGRLCADAGTAIGMKYKQSSSGANTAEVDEALKRYFKYRNGLSLDSKNQSSKFLRPIRTNLQADRPVFLSIKRTGGGHAILCDGYGYSGSTLYHHLNMGWASGADAWYNLPTIDPPGGSAYSSIRSIVYNVSPSATGEIISGRVLDSGGGVVAGATVRAQRRSGGAIYTMTSDSRGYFGKIGFPSRNRYNLWATRSGYRGVRKSNVYLGRSSTTSCQNYEWYPTLTADAMKADLLLSRMEWDVSAGRIRFRIRNRGPKNLSGLNRRLRLNVYLSSDRRRGDADDRYVGGVTFNWTILSGAEARMTWSYGSKISPSGIPAGRYYVYGRIEHKSPSRLTDSRMADNYRWRTGRVTVSSGAPPPSPDGPSADTLWLASATPPGESQLLSASGAPIPAITATETAPGAALHEAPPGVDAELSATAIVPPPSGPAVTVNATECDMAMSDLTFLPRTLEVGQYPTSVTYRVQNQGPADLEGTNTPVRFNFYMSSNTTFGDDDDIILGEAASNPEILSGHTSSRYLTSNGLDNLVVPDEAFGTYYLFVEGMHVLPSPLEDSDPSDDYTQLPGTVVVPANTMVADLGITNFAFLPETIEMGAHPTSVLFRVTNGGPHDLEGSNQAFRLDFYLSRNETFGDGDDIMVGEADASWAIPSGSDQGLMLTESGLQKVTVPEEPSGNYNIFIQVRHNEPSRLRDQSPDNDYAIAAGSIYVTPAESTEADIAIERFEFLPDRIAAGTRSTSVTYRVTNHGPRDIEINAHTLCYDYALSRNTVLGDSDDVALGSVVSSNASISAGAHSDRRISGGLLVPASAWGEYNVFVSLRHDDDSPLSDPDPNPDSNVAPCPHPLTVTGGISLGEALDAPTLDWSTTGDSYWYSQADDTHDGTDAARCGDNLPRDARSRLHCRVDGPGTVSFWWKVSSEGESDWLRFSVGELVKASISGTNASAWVQESVDIPAGAHTLTWSYDKDRSEGEGDDAGWVDQVSFVPVAGSPGVVPSVAGTVPAVALTEPADRAVFTEPATIAITADTSGSPEEVVQVQFYANGVYLGIDTYADTNRFGVEWIDVPVGSYTLTAKAWTATGSTALSAPIIVRVSPPGLVLSMSGESDWFEQAGVTHDGREALQSGAIDHDETSVVDASVEGPGVMQFWWKVSSEDTYDRVRFYQDGEESEHISGDVDWALKTVTVPAGTHAFTWSYDKDFSVTGGADAAWLDELEWFSSRVDTDGDGHSDLQEHWSGTDRTNYHSCLRIESVVVRPLDGEVHVEWQSRAGKQYTVERATVLSEGAFAPIKTGIAGQDGTTTHTDRGIPPDTPAYYRVRTE